MERAAPLNTGVNGLPESKHQTGHDGGRCTRQAEAIGECRLERVHRTRCVFHRYSSFVDRPWLAIHLLRAANNLVIAGPRP